MISGGRRRPHPCLSGGPGRTKPECWQLAWQAGRRGAGVCGAAWRNASESREARGGHPGRSMQPFGLMWTVRRKKSGSTPSRAGEPTVHFFGRLSGVLRLPLYTTSSTLFRTAAAQAAGAQQQQARRCCMDACCCAARCHAAAGAHHIAVCWCDDRRHMIWRLSMIWCLPPSSTTIRRAGGGCGRGGCG
jgi:hypothetical protein